MKKKILIVDDSALGRMMLRDTFLFGGEFHVIMACDGQEGLEMFREEHPDVVITDLHMPRMDGMELLRAIKAESPRTPVIMVTGRSSEVLAREAFSAGASDFLSRPFLIEEIEQAVREALGKE